MIFAVGFPSSSSNDGFELLCAVATKPEKDKFVAAAKLSGKYQRIGVWLNPPCQFVSLQKPIFSQTDCSAAHNAGLAARRASLASGDLPEVAERKAAVAKYNSAQAEAAPVNKQSETNKKKK